jgi:hypothetical protein
MCRCSSVPNIQAQDRRRRTPNHSGDRAASARVERGENYDVEAGNVLAFFARQGTDPATVRSLYADALQMVDANAGRLS